MPLHEPILPIRLIALDIDGTLIGDDLTITPRTRAAVRAARARGVAISLGAEGMFWQESRDSAPLVARPPRVEGRSAVGCGDASLAGFAVARRRGLAGREFVKFAAACGTANCLADAPGMIDRRAVERLLPQSSDEGVDGRE